MPSSLSLSARKESLHCLDVVLVAVGVMSVVIIVQPMVLFPIQGEELASNQLTVPVAIVGC